MNVFKILATIIGRYINDTVKIKSINKEDLRKVLKDNIKRHSGFVTTMKRLSDNECNTFKDRYLENVEAHSRIASATIHLRYLKGLKGSSLSKENSRFLKSLQSANSDMKDILTDLEKQFDTLFNDQYVVLSNVRMTHIAALGIIKQSEILATWSQLLWSQMLKLATNQLVDIPKYRVEYLLKNVDQVIKTVNHINNKTGIYTFLNEVAQLKRKEADFLLGFHGGTSFLDLMRPNTFTAGFIDNIESALSIMNIFRWGSDKWDDWLYVNNMKDRETLRWMEQHVALLRADMLGISPTDPRYKKMVDVISAYDIKISEYDQKIRKYEEGE